MNNNEKCSKYFIVAYELNMLEKLGVYFQQMANSKNIF